MSRVLMAILCAALSLTIPVLERPAVAAPVPTHNISVSGTDVAMYPAFATGVERYGLTTTAATGGTVTMVASTSDPAGTVSVNGRIAPGGVATLKGLTGGDEISVIIKDAGGVAVHSLIFLPARFPKMTEVVPAAPSTAPGDVLVNLSRYAPDGSPSFNAVLDNHGVPRHVESLAAGVRSGDLKPDGVSGHYTVFRSPTPTPNRLGNQLVELDERFEEVRRYETQGDLVHTDSHDSVLRADGSRILLAYEPNSQTGLQDAVIQEVNAAGQVVYTWDSAEHMNPATETTTTPGLPDYAHINSIQVMTDGDILASFRHTSSVMKIAWTDHSGFDRGDIVWRLGGRQSDFTFVDDPYPSGPCAQHTASELDNGNILIFDNGSVVLGDDPAHCVDPADPTGPTVARQQTRVTEYAVDASAGTATLVWSYQVTGRFTYFAGSARRLSNGNTLVGWAAERRATATEVNAAGDVLWELRNDDDYLSYRVVRTVVPDAIKPVVRVDTPVQGASYANGQRVTPVVTCTDQGGSSLQTCAASRQPLNTSTPGKHSYTATATDGDGNTTSVARSYTVGVLPASRPDANIRTAGGGWVGNNVYGSSARQQVAQSLRRRGAKATSIVRVQNEGNRADRIVVRGTSGTHKFGVKYFLRGSDVTGQVRAGTLRVSLVRGGYVDLGVVVQRLRRAKVRNTMRVLVTASSGFATRQPDTVGETVRATR